MSAPRVTKSFRLHPGEARALTRLAALWTLRDGAKVTETDVVREALRRLRESEDPGQNAVSDA